MCEYEHYLSSNKSTVDIKKMKKTSRSMPGETRNEQKLKKKKPLTYEQLNVKQQTGIS